MIACYACTGTFRCVHPLLQREEPGLGAQAYDIRRDKAVQRV